MGETIDMAVPPVPPPVTHISDPDLQELSIRNKRLGEVLTQCGILEEQRRDVVAQLDEAYSDVAIKRRDYAKASNRIMMLYGLPEGTSIDLSSGEIIRSK